MRTNQEVLRDIKNAPYRDVQGIIILPGQFVCIGFNENNESVCALVSIDNGDLNIGGVPIDDMLENHQLAVMGWMQ